MSQSKLLPAIPVKHVAIRKVLNITSPLEAKLRAYIAYYTEEQRLDRKHAPTGADTIIALLESFLARDSGFNRYLRERASSRPGTQKKAAVAKGAAATETS